MLSERFEYILKGVFLGLMFFVSLNAPDWEATGRVALFMLAGLGIAVFLGVLRQFRDLGRLGSNPGGFFLFLLLENPFLIYTGLIFGLAAGAISEQHVYSTDGQLGILTVVGAGATRVWDILNAPGETLWFCVAGGALLGYGFAEMRQIKDNWYRFGVPLVAMVVVGMIIDNIFSEEGYIALTDERKKLLAMHLLVALPFFYLLTFTGVAEESEVEIAALCGSLGIAIHQLKLAPFNMPGLALLMPVTLYFVYAVYVLPGLRVFKHTLRGYSYLHLGKIYPSLIHFRRALQLDRKNQLAQRGLWQLHRGLDLNAVVKDPRIVELLEPSQILGRVGELLAQPPRQAQLDEACQLLELVEKQWPAFQSQVDYQTAIAALHVKQYDRAAELMTKLLDPMAWPADDKARKTILFDAWQLALLGHPELKRRVGEPQLELPGRRIEAITAVERKLTKTPGDSAVQELRKTLYDSLREDEYAAAAADGAVNDFGYAYAEAQGMSLIDDPERWTRGALFLRIAGHGLPDRGPVIFDKLAQAYENRDDKEAARRYREKVRDAGLAVGTTNLAADAKQIYFATVKRLADEAMAREDWDEAIANLQLVTHSEGSGIETLRSLVQAYMNKHDVLNAMRVTEKGLLYDKRDADLLAKKDSIYYSIEPPQLKEKAAEVRTYFDTYYCVKKAKELLDKRNTELDIVDWAQQLAKLALVMEPKNIVAIVQLARCHLRRGEREEGLKLLEDVFHEMTPSGGEEKEAWFFAAKQLGKLYLDELSRPDLAIPCFQKYQESLNSGAETIYDLGRAFEANGNHAKAIQFYKTVTGYEENPLRWDAEEAIRRLQGQA